MYDQIQDTNDNKKNMPMSLKRRSRASSDSFNSDDDINTPENTSNLNGGILFTDKRKSRNENEKKRRDVFNSLIDDLAKLHNHEHKKDKSTVLLETLNIFKANHHTTHNSTNNLKTGNTRSNERDCNYGEWRPAFIDMNDFVNLICDFKNTFYLVFDLNTSIKYVSDSVAQLLGYLQKDLEGRELTQFIGQKSAKLLQSNLKKRKFNNNDKISFNCTWKSWSHHSAQLNNEQSLNGKDIKISGYYKSSSNIDNVDQLDATGLFITIATLDNNLEINQIYLLNSSTSKLLSNNESSSTKVKQFNSQLSMNLKYTNVDLRSLTVLGYIQNELINTLFYDYIHVDDLDKLIDCHKQLVKTGAATSHIYRFKTKGNEWILLRTHFNLIFNPLATNNTEPQSIFCTNNIINIKDLFLVSNNQLFNLTASSSATAASATSTPSSVNIDNSSANKSIKNRKLNSTDELISLRSPVTLNHHQQSSHDATSSYLLPSINDSIGINTNDNQKLNVINNEQLKQQQHIQKTGNSIKSSSSSSNGNSKNIVNNKVISKIILMSYKQPQFRKFVCAQLKLEREKADELLKQQTLRLKEIEQIINFFQDDDKLGKWVNEVKKSIVTCNQTNAHQEPTDKQQQQQQQSQIYTNVISGNGGNTLINNRTMSQPTPIYQRLSSINNTTQQNIDAHNNNNNITNANNSNRQNNNTINNQMNQNNNNLSTSPTNTLNMMMNLNDDLMIDDIDIEVLDRLLEEYSFKSFNFFN